MYGNITRYFSMRSIQTELVKTPFQYMITAPSTLYRNCKSINRIGYHVPPPIFTTSLQTSTFLSFAHRSNIINVEYSWPMDVFFIISDHIIGTYREKERLHNSCDIWPMTYCIYSWKFKKCNEVKPLKPLIIPPSLRWISKWNCILWLVLHITSAWSAFYLCFAKLIHSPHSRQN